MNPSWGGQGRLQRTWTLRWNRKNDFWFPGQSLQHDRFPGQSLQHDRMQGQGIIWSARIPGGAGGACTQRRGIGL